jgi:mRNA-degrading endonuclease RelE of RelBE toxin-antitoxin system
MIFRRTARFDKAYRRLAEQDQRRVDRALRTFAQSPHHPSLHTEKLAGKVWSIRASRRLRCTFEWGDSVTLRNVGYHDEVYRSV